jgi:cytochrome c
MNRVLRWRTFLTAAGQALAFGHSASAVPIEDVLKQIDPATGKAKDTTTAFGINGIISARATLADGQVFAFVQPTGKAGLPILVSKAEAEKIIPRNELNLTGTFADGPFGFFVLKIKDGSLTVSGTNKAFGAAEPRGADLFKDASSLAGRYVSLTNVTFAAPKFDGSGKIKVKGEAGEVSLLLPTTLKDRGVPPGGVKVFGVPVKVDGEWRLMASRFLSVSNKANLALATKHTRISCHNPDIKAVGPACRDVAAKYKDDPAAKATLIAQIEKGGTGKWGVVPMPPLGAKVPPVDREVLIDWVLGYRWDAILAE